MTKRPSPKTRKAAQQTPAEQPDAPKPPATPYGDLYVKAIILCGVLIGGFIVSKFIAPALLPGHVEMLVFFVPMGAMLMISGLGLLDVNSRKTKDFVSSAPYGGKVEGLSRGQALFFNWVLVLMGFATIVAGVVIYLRGPVG